MKRIVCTFLALLIFTGMAMGKTEITPIVKVEQMVDDNIYLDSESLNSSSVTNFRPALQIASINRKNVLLFNGGGDFFFYAKDPDRNNAQHGIFKLLGNFDFAGGMTLGVKNNFLNTSDPASSELTERVKRVENRSGLNVGYKISRKTSIDVSGLFVLHNYKESGYSHYERSEISGASTLFFQALPKTSILASLGLGTINYDSADRDLGFSQIELGIKGDFTSKTHALVKGGYHIRNYSDSSIDDFNAPVFSLEVGNKFSPNTSLSLSGVYGLNESFYGTNSHYKFVKGIIGLNQKVMNKINGYIGIDMMVNNYPDETTESSVTKKRKDNILGSSLKLDYDVNEWIGLGANYRYRNRDSNHSAWDYTNNKFNLQIVAKFK